MLVSERAEFFWICGCGFKSHPASRKRKDMKKKAGWLCSGGDSQIFGQWLSVDCFCCLLVIYEKKHLVPPPLWCTCVMVGAKDCDSSSRKISDVSGL